MVEKKPRESTSEKTGASQSPSRQSRVLGDAAGVDWDGFCGPSDGEFGDRQRCLTASLIPGPMAPWSAIGEFADSFDAYAVFDADTSSGFAQLADLANNSRGDWSVTMRLSDDLVELRSCLFFERRRYRHFGDDPEGDDLAYTRALVEAIRAFV